MAWAIICLAPNHSRKEYQDDARPCLRFTVSSIAMRSPSSQAAISHQCMTPADIYE